MSLNFNTKFFKVSLSIFLSIVMILWDILHLSEWQDVYHSDSNVQEAYTESKLYNQSAGNFYVRKVTFSSLKSGAIYLNSKEGSSLISSCTFINNSNTENYQGGSITLNCANSALQRSCSIESRSSSNLGTVFAQITDSTEDGLNLFSEISVSSNNCGNKIGLNGIKIEYGKISFSKNNLTKNYAESNSAFSINTASGNINYSLIYQNEAEFRIISQYDKHANYSFIIFTNNTINRTDSNFHGMIYCENGNMNFDNCYFENNNQSNEYFFGANNGYICLFQCQIDLDSDNEHFASGRIDREVSMG